MNGCGEDCSWEDIYDSGQLDQQLENFDSDQLEPIGREEQEKPETSVESSQLRVDKQQIKILKRSESSRDSEVERCHPENRHLIEQSVAQREKDYAMARERIMGSAKAGKGPERRRDKNNHRRNNNNNGNNNTTQPRNPG